MMDYLLTSALHLQNSFDINFWVMNVSVTLMVFSSACYAEVFIRNQSNKYRVLYIPATIFDQNIPIVGVINQSNSMENHRKSFLLWFLFCTILYFLVILASVAIIEIYPKFIVYVQYSTIFGIIYLFILQYIKCQIAIPLSVLYTITWMMSGNTQYRWIINNTIVVMVIIMTGYIEFQSFVYLQVFMWLAFFYDLTLLGDLHAIRGAPELFTYNSIHTNVTQNLCSALLCSLQNHNNFYELPTVFAMQLNSNQTSTYIGAGDIIIGAFLANFALLFFQSKAHLAFNVGTFSVAVGFLVKVESTPFPALAIIVPICTMGFLISITFSGKYSARDCKNTIYDAFAQRNSQFEVISIV